MTAIEVTKIENPTFFIAEGMTAVPTERVIAATQAEVEGIRPQAISLLKEELGLADEAYTKLVRIEEQLDHAIQGSIFLNTSKALIDFRIGQYLALFEESLPQGYFETWIRSKVPEQKLETWKFRYTQWQKLQFAVALGAAKEGIAPEEYLLKYPDISTQVWCLLGSRRCPEEVSEAAYSLIREGHQIQTFQIRASSRSMIAGGEEEGEAINKEEKIQIARDVIRNTERTPTPAKKTQAKTQAVQVQEEILDADFTEASETPTKDPTLELIAENRRLRDLLAKETQEKNQLLVKVTQLQVQIDLYKANATTANTNTVVVAEESDRIIELREMPLSEVRKKAETTSSVMDLRDIAQAWNITLVESYQKEVIRGEVLAALPQVFDEQFSE